jgi:hypothetical protein
LWHNYFTSLVIDVFSQPHSISLIFQDQRGFLLFLMVDSGGGGQSAALTSLPAVLEKQPTAALNPL